MNNLILSYAKTCGILEDELAAFGEQLKPEIERINNAFSEGYKTDYASVNLPLDEELWKQVKQLIDKKRALRPSSLVVIGIGGSNLGAKAVHEAIHGLFYNEQQPNIKIYWADTVDTDYILDIVLLIEQELQQGKAVLLNVISKSGKTTETIANFGILFDLLRRYRPQDYREYIVVTTDEGSPLWNFAENERLDRLPVPKKVGGRYSVFSAFGLFSLGLLGIDVEQLRAGARKMAKACVSQDVFENPAALIAVMLYGNYRRGLSIHNMFFFSVDLGSLGMWYRQLLAESIGKEHDKNGKEVNVGITPTISIGSTDLHSMAQLHLGGPRDTFTTFVSIDKNKSNVPVPCYDEIEQLVEHIQCKPLSIIMNAILHGVQHAYEKGRRPFNTIIFPKKNAWYIGQFMQLHMITIMYLGYLLNINPFDQPEVELYKKEVRKMLSINA